MLSNYRQEPSNKEDSKDSIGRLPESKRMAPKSADEIQRVDSSYTSEMLSGEVPEDSIKENQELLNHPLDSRPDDPNPQDKRRGVFPQLSLVWEPLGLPRPPEQVEWFMEGIEKIGGGST